MEIQKLDLLLVTGSSILDRAIEDISHSEFSHCAGFVDDGHTLIEAQGFRRVGYQNPEVYRGHGVVYRSFKMKPHYAAYGAADATRYIGKHYSYALIAWEFVRYELGVLLPFWRHNPIICSTLWQDVYRDIGIELCPKVRFASPGDLAESRLLMPVGKW